MTKCITTMGIALLSFLRTVFDIALGLLVAANLLWCCFFAFFWVWGQADLTNAGDVSPLASEFAESVALRFVVWGFLLMMVLGPLVLPFQDLQISVFLILGAWLLVAYLGRTVAAKLLDHLRPPTGQDLFAYPLAKSAFAFTGVSYIGWGVFIWSRQ